MTKTNGISQRASLDFSLAFSLPLFSALSVFVGVFHLSGCGPNLAVEQSLHPSRQSVLDGQAHPSDFGLEIDAPYLNAIGALYSTDWGGWVFCSATLIGDRLALTAAHCVLGNKEAWLEGAVAQPFDDEAVAKTRFLIGTDIDTPHCTLEIESIHTHPQSIVRDRDNAPQRTNPHDMAVLVLAQSALQHCAPVWPLPIRSQALTTSMYGENLLQGGFGAISDVSPAEASSVRYYSHSELGSLTDVEIGATWLGAGHGSPYHGDSGSPILRQASDGRWEIVGVVSNVFYHARVDTDADFIRSFYGDNQLCGASSRCVENTVLSCHTDTGYETTTCSNRLQCATDEDGAFCACQCNHDDYCSDDCSCDADCPCDCDTNDTCSMDCSCDADCREEHSPGFNCQQARSPAPWMSLLAILLVYPFRRRRGF